MNTNELELSIIIVNWNTCDFLARALTCIYTTVQNSSYEVVVVDNASSDGSAAMVRERFPQAVLIANSENLGFGRANNQAAVLARGRYLLLLNPDAFVHPGTIDRLVAFMDACSAAAGAGCRLVFADGRLQRSCTSFPTLATELWSALWLDRLFARHSLFGRYQMTYWDMGDLREVDSIMGACLILRRTAIEQTGLFDEQFFMYSEEVDLCFRLKRAGWKLYFVPDAAATHIWVGTAYDTETGKVKVQVEPFLRMYKSRVLFFRKHYGRFAATLYKLILLLSSILKVIAGLVLLIFQRDQRSAGKLRNYGRLFQYVWSF